MSHRHLSLLLTLGVGVSILAQACVPGAPAAVASTPTFAPAAVPASMPEAGSGDPGGAPGGAPGGGPAYTFEQAISDRAQLNTIAFDALGFLTGTLNSDSFFPPGKVADFWGFQYLRDNDPTEMGHNTDFLTSASLNMLTVLTTAQREQLAALAKGQVASINEYGYKRFTLMKAFRRLLEGDLPAGTAGLDEVAVTAYSAELYSLDGKISLERAQVMGPILASLTSDQRAYLDAMKGKGMATWPKVTEPVDLRGLSRDEKVAVMTYAGDLFSWYVGSVEADTYFCPERHGTYFGSFYLKDAPAVGNPGYSIDTTITGNLGAALLEKLDAIQAAKISGLVDSQRGALTRIVDVRRSVSTALRALQSGGSVDTASVAALMKTYGELDGSIVYQYATAFAAVGKSLTSAERVELMALRTTLLGDLSAPARPYLYSQPTSTPTIPDTDFLFGAGNTSGTSMTATSSLTLRIAGGHRASLTTTYGTARSVRSGTYVTLRAALTPASSNQPVRFYRRIGTNGSWTYLSTARMDATGVAVWSRVVSVPATATGSGRSVWFKVALPGTSGSSGAWSNAVRAVVK